MNKKNQESSKKDSLWSQNFLFSQQEGLCALTICRSYFFEHIWYSFYDILITSMSSSLNRAYSTPVIVAIDHLFKLFLLFVKICWGRMCSVGWLWIFLALRFWEFLLFRLESEWIVHSTVIAYPDESVIVFYLIHPSHVLVKIIIDIFAAVTSIKSLQK